MIKEESEDLNTPRRKKLRSVEPYSLQDENEKLIRQNRELEKTVERLEFFNKLLEKEVNELKNPDGLTLPQKKRAEHFANRRKSRGVSRLAFYALFFITLILAALVAYSLYYGNADIPFLRRIQGKPPVTRSVELVTPNAAVPGSVAIEAADNKKSAEAQTLKKNETPVKPEKSESSAPPKVTKEEASAAQAPAKNNTAVQDKNVPPANQPAAQKNIPVTSVEQKAVVANNSAATNKENLNPATGGTSHTPASQTAASTPVIPGSTSSNTASKSLPVTPAAVTSAPAAAPAATTPQDKSFGFYKVASKANFYNEPNENALTGQFIYQFSPVTLEALDEKNDFIYVIAKNNLGNLSKGWLSKKDLRRID